MAKDTAISISFKISEDANGLKHLALDAKEFRKAMQEAVHVSTEFQNKFIIWIFPIFFNWQSYFGFF